ncbi:MAG: hypothetical protein HQL98_12330 [Magnetococcales bacterium]|nr:hypothetical protein [Magnetococcales bacterium]
MDMLASARLAVASLEGTDKTNLVTNVRTQDAVYQNIHTHQSSPKESDRNDTQWVQLSTNPDQTVRCWQNSPFGLWGRQKTAF